MENAEEILQCLDEFSKVKPKDIPRELEEYLCFVAKTGDPIYQWPLIKCLFREKLINVITEFYEACPSVEIPPCPNVDAFNYDSMKSFILEKLDTFAAAPFTVQRICELLTTPRKEYNRIDKYMRALEKNILVVSTREPGNRRNTENGESVVNGLESDHVAQDIINSDINVEVEMDDSSIWPKTTFAVQEPPEESQNVVKVQDTFVSESKDTETAACSSTIETVIARPLNYIEFPPSTTVDPVTVPEEAPPAPAESPSPADSVTVTITNVTDTEIDQLADEEEEPQPEEPAVYGNAQKDTPIYLETEALYEGPENKPDTVPAEETSIAEPSPTPAPEPEQSTPTVQSTTDEKPTNDDTETEISSSDEVPTTSEIIPTTTTEEIESTTEDEVTESNIESDCSVSQTEQTETKEEEEEELSTVEETASTEAEAAVEEPVEAMEVDEVVVSESQTQNQEPEVTQTDSPTDDVN